jgi:hypothetical protein
MKYTNIQIDSDGRKVQTEHRIQWTPAETDKKLKFLGTGEEPMAVYYFPSGWNYGYPTYHVLIEFGDIGETDYMFLSENEFLEKFGVAP